MSLWAHDFQGNVVKITKNGGVSNGVITQKFYCPSCNQEMFFVSESSNKRTAHFQGHHLNGCDIGYTNGNESLYDYAFNENTLNDFLNKLKNDGVKTRTTNVTVVTPKSSMQTTQGATNVSGTLASIPKTLSVTTLRQLFNLLANANPWDTLYGNVIVRDIYCGRSTSFFYTQFITGLHLVYAQLHGYDQAQETLFFNFPSDSDRKILIIIKFSKSELFCQFIQKHRRHVHHFYLIFAEFTKSHCVIDSKTQIIHLSK